MPNCFQLTKKGNNEPSMLQDVDKAICDYFNVLCDEKCWYHDWFGSIGFSIALGSSFDKLRQCYDGYCLIGTPEEIKYWGRMREIVDFLDREYTTTAWAER